MKKLSIFVFVIIGIMLFITSCDKKLNLVNPNSPTSNGYWVTEKQALDASTGIYNALTVDGTYMRSFPGLTDSRGDDFYGDSPWTDLVLTGQFLIPSTSAPVQWIWRDFYQVVFRANEVIEGVGGMDPSIINGDLKNRILGQAYFLRGLAYYNLATSFKVVPVIITPEYDPKVNPATATEDALWNQIFTDLQTAETDLPVSYTSVTGADLGQVGRATKGAAAGLLGKAYLYRKDYAKAGVQFEKFISGPLKDVYSLMPNYSDNFKDVNENNAESLFEVQFTETGGSVDNWCCEPSADWKQWTSFSITYGQEGYGGFSDYLPTRWIYDEYKKEKTVAGKDDPRLLTTIASYEPDDNSITAYGQPWKNPLTNIYPRKYTNDLTGKPGESIGGSGINYRVLRYADILLMYAEVLNELGQTEEAYPYIQQVRTRANLPDLAIVKPNMTQAEMRDQLAHERALEFAIEGQRINDIIRWGWLYNPTKLDELKAHDASFTSWTAGNEYLPVPQTELDLDPNVLPNPAN